VRNRAKVVDILSIQSYRRACTQSLDVAGAGGLLRQGAGTNPGRAGFSRVSNALAICLKLAGCDLRQDIAEMCWMPIRRLQVAGLAHAQLLGKNIRDLVRRNTGMKSRLIFELASEK
jgi:hypothetical protein